MFGPRSQDDAEPSKRPGCGARSIGGVESRAGGFTLVELLVAVFIIVLLTAIASRMYLASLDSARNLQCLSNLGQIAKSTVAWSADNSGRLPHCGCWEGPGDITGLLQPYTGEEYATGMWRCPSVFTFGPGWTTAYGYNWQYLFSPGPKYPHSGWSGFGNRGLKVSQVNRPATTLMWVDQDPIGGNVNLWSYVQRPGDTSNIDGFGRPALRHPYDLEANVAYVDGHAAPVSSDITTTASEPTYWAAQ